MKSRFTRRLLTCFEITVGVAVVSYSVWFWHSKYCGDGLYDTKKWIEACSFRVKSDFQEWNERPSNWRSMTTYDLMLAFSSQKPSASMDAGMKVSCRHYIDEWARPLVFSRTCPLRVSSDERVDVIFIWSCGENGIDEDGSGDDILSVVNLTDNEK